MPDAESVPAFDEEDELEEEEEQQQGIYPGTLRTPLNWERLLVESAVIAGRERWRERLGRLRAQILVARREAVDAGDEIIVTGIDQNIAALDNLEAFALPLIAEIDALPEEATWAVWLDDLTGLATRALRNTIAKNGAPRNAVMIPTGISAGASKVRAPRSAATRNAPPNRNESGRSAR